MSTIHITEDALTLLRKAVEKRITGKRFLHTLGVEKEIARLGKVYLPQNIPALRAAALLHDITKECTLEEQLQLCRRFAIEPSRADRLSPKIFHAWTAACLIKEEFPAFATTEIIEAVGQHTTGMRGMSLFSKLLYLADYIEETRTFPDCVALREAFWRPMADLPPKERLPHLDRILLKSFDLTINSLLVEGSVIAPATIDTRNWLIEEFNTHNGIRESQTNKNK